MEFKHNEANVEDTSTSKTLQCQSYSFLHNSLIYRFIDTPGISDVGGYLKDNVNVDMIFNTIEELAHLHAIILVLNGALARVTVNVKNVLTRFAERIPDALHTNLVVLLTNCEKYSCNFGLESVGLPSTCSVLHMQNSAFSNDPRDLDKKTKKYRSEEWDKSMNILKKFINYLSSMEPMSTEVFRSLHSEQNAIKNLLHESRLIIMELQQIDDALCALQTASDVYSIEKTKYKDFYEDKQVSCQEWVQTDYHNTICMRCNKICHERCTLEETNGAGAAKFCMVFNRYGECQKCRCSSDDHHHNRKTLRSVTKSIRMAVSDLETKFQRAEIGQSEVQRKNQSVQDTREMLRGALHSQLSEIERCCWDVKDQCSGYNPLVDLTTFVSLVEQDSALLKSKSTQKEAENFIENLKKLCQDLNSSKKSKLVVVNNAEEAPLPTDTSSSSETEDVVVKKSARAPPATLHSPPLSRKKKGKRVGQKKKEVVMEQMEVDSDLEREVYKDQHSSEGINYESTDDGTSIKEIGMSLNQAKLSAGEQSSVTKVLPSVKAADERGASAGRSLLLDRLPQQAGDIRCQVQASALRSHSGQEYKKELTSRLLELYESKDDHASRKEIEKELNRRCHGESVGFLDPNQLQDFVNHVLTYGHNEERIFKHYHDLTREIQELIDFDPLKIEKVSEKKLLELAAIKQLLTRKVTK